MPKGRPQQRTRRWKRTAATALLLLAGGAVVNFVVASGFALTSTLAVHTGAESFLGYSHGGAHTSRYDWALLANGERGSLMILLIVEPVQRNNQVEEVRIRLEDDEGPQFMPQKWAMSAKCLPEVGSDCAAGFAVAYGWPFLSHYAVFHDTSHNQASPSYSDFEVVGFSAIVVGDPHALISPPLSLPLALIYPGFAFNTVFYALLLWLLIFVPFTARRVLRRKRRLCEKCAYPIGVSPVCTECGAAVRRS